MDFRVSSSSRRLAGECHVDKGWVREPPNSPRMNRSKESWWSWSAVPETGADPGSVPFTMPFHAASLLIYVAAGFTVAHSHRIAAVDSSQQRGRERGSHR